MAEKSPRSVSSKDHQVSVRLRAAREAAGLTQHGLGQAVGITYQQMQKYEAGTNRISAGRLYDIACVLNRPMSYFFGSDETEAAAEGDLAIDAIDLLRQPQGLRLATAATRLDRETLLGFVGLMEAVVRAEDRAESRAGQ